MDGQVRRHFIVGAIAFLSIVAITGCAEKQADTSAPPPESQTPAGHTAPSGALHTYNAAIPSGNEHNAPPGSAMPPGGPKIPGR